MSASDYIKEPFPALSHLLGVALSIVALIVLLQASGNSDRAIVSSAIYGSSLILLYSASTLFHAIACSSRAASRLEKFDYAAIFLFIAGTYTPICLLVIRGKLGWAILIAEWILAVRGIFTIFSGSRRSRSAMVRICLVMGWLFLAAIGPLFTTLPAALFPWLIAGSLFYSIGAAIFLCDWPALWKGCFSAHDFWHVFVLGGSACHFIVVDYFVRLYAS